MNGTTRRRTTALIRSASICTALLFSTATLAAVGFRPAAVLVEARSAASTIEEPGERAGAVDSLLLAQVSIDPAGAKETLTQFPRLPNRLHHFVSLSAKYADAGNVEETEKMYAEIRLEEPSSERGKLAAAQARGYLAMAYAKAGQIDEALRTMAQIRAQQQRDPGIIVTALSAIATAQAKRGDIAGGVRTAVSIAHEYPYTLMQIVAEQSKTGTSDIRDLVSKLDETLQSYAQWGIVQAEMALGRTTDAQLTASSIKPGHAKASALLELANYHLKAGRPAIATTLLKEAATAALATVNGETRADLLWRIAKAMAETRDIPAALETARSIQNLSHRDAALCDIVKVQAKHRDIKGALNNAILLKRENDADPGNLTKYEFAVSDILEEWTKAGGAKDAREMVSNFAELKPRHRLLYARIARAQAEHGDVRGANATLQLVETSQQRATREKAIQRLLSQFDMTAEDKAQLTGLQELDVAVSMTIKAVSVAHARKGEIQEAYVITKALKSPYRSPTIQELSETQVRFGRAQQAMTWSRGLAHPAEKTYALIGAAQGLASVKSR